MRRLAVVFAINVALAGCASMTVSSHIERGVDFNQFVTYDWGPPDNLPVGDPRLDNNPFFNDYLQGAIEKNLAMKGFVRVFSGTPDLLVHYHASVNERMDVYEIDNRYGYCYQDCQPQITNYEQGTLIVDVVDTKTNKVVWRGWAQDTMNGVIDNQDRLDKQVEEGVTKMMRLLPAAGDAVR